MLTSESLSLSCLVLATSGAQSAVFLFKIFSEALSGTSEGRYLTALHSQSLS